MASNVKFTVEGKGKNLKKTAKDAKAVGDGAEHAQQGLDKAAKAGDKYHKSQKGVAGVSSNSTKNFSKMRGAMGGSSGLVGAYATLAANVFAATAAFDQLRRAAQFEIMVEGLNAVGAAAGRNLNYAASQLRMISGEALSAEASVRVMSLGISAGFRTDQMERLTVVARGASLALGRDMTDALDRLTRGTAKLEPEILDELGIMVRLDDAALKYATTLGKSVQDLTQYERRQAFLNETLEQGEKKFGQLAEQIDVNPYDKLGASLNNLAKSFLSAVNKVLIPTIEILTENSKALTGVLVVFATSIFRHLLPAVTSMAGMMITSAAATEKDTVAKQKNLMTGRGLPGLYNKSAAEIAKYGMSQERFNTGLRSLNASLAAHNVQQANMTKNSAVEIAAYNVKTAAIERVSLAKKELIAVYLMEQISQAKTLAGEALLLIAQGNLIAGGRALSASIAMQATAYWAAAAGGTAYAKVLAVVRIAAMATWRVLAGMMTMLMGPWGIALIALSMVVYAFWDDIVGYFDDGVKEVKRDSAEMIEALEHIKLVGEQFEITLARAGGTETASTMVAGFRALNGIMQETQSHLKKVDKLARDNHSKRMVEMRAEIAAQNTIVQQQEASIAKMRAQKAVPWISVWLAESDLEDSQAVLDALEDQMANAQAAMEAQLKKDKIDIVQTMIDNTKGSGAFAKFAQKETTAMQAELDRFKSGEIDADQLIAGIERLRTGAATVVGAFDNAQDALSKFNQETNKLATKDSTPFDKALEAAKGLRDLVREVAAGGKDLGLDKERAKMLAEEIGKQTGKEGMGIKDLDSWYKGLEDARDRIIESKGAIKKLQAEQKRLNTIQGKMPMTQQMSIKLSEKQEEIRRKELKALQDTLILEKGLANTEVARLTTTARQLEGKKGHAAAVEAMEEAQQRFAARTADTEALILAKKTEQVGEEEKLLKSKVDGLAMEEAMLKAVKAQTQAQIKLLELSMSRKRASLELRNLSDPSRVRAIGGAITPQQEFALAKSNRDLKIEIIKKNTKMMVDEAKLTVRRVKLETDLQILKLNIMLRQKDLTDDERTLITDIMSQSRQLATMQTNAAQMRITAAEKEGEIALLNLEVEEKRLGIASRRGLAGSTSQGATSADRIVSGGFALRDAAKGTAAYVKSEKRQRLRAQREINQAVNAEYGKTGKVLNDADALKAAEKGWGDSLENMVEKWTEASGVMSQAMKDAFADLDIGQQWSFLSGSLQPLIEGFRSLGPEGVAIANGMQQANIGMSGMFTTMGQMGTMMKDGGFEKIGDVFSQERGEDMSGMADKAGAVAGGIGMAAGAAQALFATQKMASEVGIARLDQEIAMEKKRDGMSAKSLAKIKKMEADKEKLKKKAFEQDKKAKIAGAIMAGAMAIMQAWAMNPIAGAIMTPIIAAITAMQIGIISSMQYQGGGGKGVGGGGTPSKLTLGSRSNKVDVAGGSAGGELSYLRGGRGIGSNASDFSRRGAFTGAKYRAVGGAAYVVGEQGPEVIVPEAPGRIIPNDELGAGGVPISATFNINTIDAANMEETLVSQRGNIINMIREAANNQGETFLEGLDTMALGDS